MTSVLEQLETFVNGLGLGMAPIPPDPNTLGDFTPDLNKLPRDSSKIIMQSQKSGNDGGDSAHRTGVAAFCNSAMDKALLPKFENGKGLMIRHPTQPPWNDPNNCSLDQLKGYAAGCWRAGRVDIMKRLLAKCAERAWTCQNIEDADPGPPVNVKKKNPPVGDLIQPHEIMCLRIASGDTLAYQDPIAQFWMYGAIQIADRSNQADNNNLMFESILCGRLNLFVAAHPNFRDFVRYYWSGWRAQPQMADAVIAVVQKELTRYPFVKFPLLPENVLNLLKTVNLDNELRNLDPAHHAQLALRFAEASLRDAANMLAAVKKMNVQTIVNQLKKLNPHATVDQITNALTNSKQPADAVRAGLVAAGIPADQINRALKAILPPEPLRVPPHPGMPPLPSIPKPRIRTPRIPKPRLPKL